MKQWVRLETDAFCGSCGASLLAGTTVRRLTLSGVQRALIRCETCVGEKGPVFAPVPRPVRSAPRPPAMTPLKDVAGFDWKQKAAGE